MKENDRITGLDVKESTDRIMKRAATATERPTNMSLNQIGGETKRVSNTTPKVTKNVQITSEKRDNAVKRFNLINGSFLNKNFLDALLRRKITAK